jgi:predicted transcriptional regulator
MGGVREEAQKLIDALPEETSWDDLIYQMYVRKKIAKGIEAAEQGRVVPHDEVKKQFLTIVHGSRDLTLRRTGP